MMRELKIYLLQNNFRVSMLINAKESRLHRFQSYTLSNPNKMHLIDHLQKKTLKVFSFLCLRDVIPSNLSP